MTTLPVAVGLDYHSRFIQVCVLDSDGAVLWNVRVRNSVEEVMAVISRFGVPKAVAIEACCGASNFADELIQLTGWRTELAHPGYVARMKGSPDKTDFSDAQLLADLVRVGYLPVVWLAPQKVRELRRLVRYRNTLVKRRRSTKLRVRGLLREHRYRSPESVNAWTKTWYSWLKRQNFSESDQWILDQLLQQIDHETTLIKEAEAQLKKATENDLVVTKLLGMPGVGLITAATLRAEVGNFERFQTGKQLARFCSVTPRNASSGNHQSDAGMIKAGSPLLRATIIEAAHRLTWQLGSRWAEMAYRLRKQGKNRNVAIAAVANRWVRWLHHQLIMEGLAT